MQQTRRRIRNKVRAEGIGYKRYERELDRARGGHGFGGTNDDGERIGQDGQQTRLT